MLHRLSYPSTFPLPRWSPSWRQCLVIYSVVCFVDNVIVFFGIMITAAFFPLQSITLRHDGCLLAKHKHLRFRLAKWRVILCTSELLLSYQKLWLLWCASQNLPPPGYCHAAMMHDCLLMGVFKNLFAWFILWGRVCSRQEKCTATPGEAGLLLLASCPFVSEQEIGSSHTFLNGPSGKTLA